MIYIRRVGEVADGSIVASKLAEGAVDLSTVKVTGQLPSDKLADGAVIEEKLANLSISTGKLKDQAVSLAKAQQALKINSFIGDETEVSTLGTTEEDQKIFRMPKSTIDTKGIDTKRIHINAEMKVTGVATGSLKLYVDDEVTPRITLNTNSNTYEMVEGDADVSDLSSGAHNVKLTLATNDIAETVYNDLIEIFLEK